MNGFSIAPCAAPGLRAVALMILAASAWLPRAASGQAPQDVATAASSAQPQDPAAGRGPAADRAEPMPPGLEGVGIAEHLDAQLPLDATFTTWDRRQVKLGDFFDGKRPVILVLNYYKCPMLCGLLLNGLLDTLREMDWTVGDQFQIVVISFNPFEGPELANLKRNNYLEQYGRPAAANGWHFLVGRQEPIRRLLETTGFSVKRDDTTGDYAHASTLILCTPDGRISRYLRGVAFDARTTRLSLVEASEGKIGTSMDQLLLFCYHYSDGQYTLAAMNVARGTGLATLALLAIVVLTYWRREVRRRRAADTPKEHPA